VDAAGAVLRRPSPYLANAADHLRYVCAAARAGLPLFAVVEDDLVRTASPGPAQAETNRRIRAAVAELPGDADTLHLEYCNEDCAPAAAS
jgi:hypothetical protein